MKKMLSLFGWILTNSGFRIMSGICSKHSSYSSSDTKSCLWRSVCLIRSFQKRISVSEESISANSGHFSIIESTISGRMCPIETKFNPSSKRLKFSFETSFIVIHLFSFVIFTRWALFCLSSLRSTRRIIHWAVFWLVRPALRRCYYLVVPLPLWGRRR